MRWKTRKHGTPAQVGKRFPVAEVKESKIKLGALKYSKREVLLWELGKHLEREEAEQKEAEESFEAEEEEKEKLIKKSESRGGDQHEENNHIS